MCGRYVIKTEKNQIEKEFATKVEQPDLLTPRFNIAPTQIVPVVVERGGERVVEGFKWGLIPSWAKDDKIGSKMINARGETIAEKPSFRTPFKKRRCIVPASGFYEWETLASGPKQPHFFYLNDHGILAFAGLWEQWRDKETGQTVDSCTIITTGANELLGKFHDRMPVILQRENYDEWLDETNSDTNSLQRLIAPFPASLMTEHEVSRAVNNVRNHDPELIEPLA